MPDPLEMIWPVVAAAWVAVGFVALLGLPWKKPSEWRVGIGWAVGVGGGFLLGSFLLGTRFRFDFGEHTNRFFLIIVPAAIVIEAVASIRKIPRLVVWLLRTALAGCLTQIMLHGSPRLVLTKFAEEQHWSSLESWMWQGSIAATLLIVWAALELLAKRAPGRSVPMALSICSGAAAVTMMLSGSVASGQPGLALAGAIGGAFVGSLFLPASSAGGSYIGVPLVCYFGLLAQNLFFSDLKLEHAAVLALAPLLAWIPDLPRLSPPWRGVLRVVLVAVPVVVILLLAGREFNKASSSTGPGSGGGGAQTESDPYADFGKN